MFKTVLRLFLTVFVGIIATAFNVHAAVRVQNSVLVTAHLQIELVNSALAVVTAGITIVYLYFQIKKIRLDLKQRQQKIKKDNDNS